MQSGNNQPDCFFCVRQKGKKIIRPSVPSSIPGQVNISILRVFNQGNGGVVVLANQKDIDWQHPIKTKAVEDSII